MKRILPLFIIIILACSINQVFAQDVKGNLAQEQIIVETFTFEKVNDKVIVKLNFNLNNLKLNSNRFLAFTPVIAGQNGEHETLQPIVISGRRQHFVFRRGGNREYANGIEVRRYNDEPQQVDYIQVVNYQPWMAGGKVIIIEDLCGCGKIYANTAPTIATIPYYDYYPEEGIVIAFVTPEVQAVKTRKEEGTAYLDFPVNQTTIYPDYRRNPVELQKIISTIFFVKNDHFSTITSIDIHGYASPEGAYQNNEHLAAGRALALKEYIRKQYDLPDSLFHVTSTPEDWAGLRTYVQDSDLAEKNEILAIIDGNLSPDAKDQAISSKYPATYRFMLENWYPALRHSDYVVNYTVRTFSLEEAVKLIFVRPQLLSLQEMFMVAQTFPADSQKYIDVFETAARLYPTDSTANLNVAIAALHRKDWKKAERYLMNAGESPQANHARGVLLLQQGQLDAAEPLLQQAVAAGIPEASTNLTILQEIRRIR